MAKYIEKARNFMKVYKQNGGVVGLYLNIFRRETFKWGTLVGEDKFGNKYYHNPYYFIGKSRWVEYSLQFGQDYDASQIPPDWHRWLQYIGDETPSKANYPHKKWMLEYTDNPTSTNKEYVPYSTTKPKIDSWVPPKSL